MVEALDAKANLLVIVPTLNRGDLVQRCLLSLQAQAFRDFEVLVVDDGSTDDIAEAVASVMPEARVLRREKNGGFAAAVNSGIAVARHDWIFLLNNDTRLEPRCLSLLMAAAEEGSAAILGPLLLFDEEPETIYAAGDRIRRNGRPESIGFRAPLEDFAFDEAPFGITAGAILIKQDVLARIGVFDERFIAYFEDADFNFRARLAGFSPELVREAVVWHLGSASISQRLWWRTRQCFRNHVLLVVKNMPLSVIAGNAGAVIAEMLRGAFRTYRAVRCDRGAVGACGEVLRVVRELVGLIPHVLSERRRIQRSRQRGGRFMRDLLAP